MLSAGLRRSAPKVVRWKRSRRSCGGRTSALTFVSSTYSAAAELDGRQDRAHHWHRAGEVQDWHDEPRLQHPPAGSARADGSCTRLSALTGGLRVPSCKGPRGRRPGVKTVPDRGLTSAQTLQPLAQLRQK